MAERAARRRRRGPVLLLLLLLIAAVGGAGWYFRDVIPGLGTREQEFAQVSPEAAAQAEAKLARLQQGDEVRLDEVELTSLLRYRLQDRIPGPVNDAAVHLDGDTVRLTGRFPTDRLPASMGLGAARAFLPDTADVEVRGKLRTFASGRAAIEVSSVSFARVPVPEQFYPEALQRLGRRDEAGLGITEYPVALPAGVGSAQVVGGELVLAPVR